MRPAQILSCNTLMGDRCVCRGRHGFCRRYEFEELSIGGKCILFLNPARQLCVQPDNVLAAHYSLKMT